MLLKINFNSIQSLIKCSVAKLCNLTPEALTTKGFATARTKLIKKTGDIVIRNNGLDAPEFLVHDGLMMLHHPLICELTAVVLYEQDLMGDQLKLHHTCEHSYLADDASLAL